VWQGALAVPSHEVEYLDETVISVREDR